MKGEIRLALYKSIKEYVPSYGDYIVWSRWLTTWHGIISNYDTETDELYIIFAGVPFLLFTQSEEEQKKETKKIKLSKIKNASQGNWAIQQHHQAHNTVIWYI